MIFKVDDYQIERADDRLSNEMTLSEGALYCQFLADGGHRNWRLPKSSELLVILNDQLVREHKRSVEDLELYYWALDDLSNSKVYPDKAHWVWPVREV